MSELREAAKEALRWMEHARLHLTIKERMHPDGLRLYDSAAEALRAALVAAREREELLDLVDSYAKDNADLKDAIRARATGETE